MSAAAKASSFDYRTAFSRNVGWVTEEEQERLRSKRVAIAGLGGVGGSHLLALTRLGIGAFSIADPDDFELANFNRQIGATLTHLGRPKVDVLAEMALDVNPELDLRKFSQPVTRVNAEEFLSDVDVYIDGLDFFAMDARRDVFAACAQKGIPSITAAPLGLGFSILTFLPGSMTFEQYFQLHGRSPTEQLLRFLVGLSPKRIQFSGLVDRNRVDLEHHRGPSTPMGTEFCAAVAASHAMKILLGRGPVPTAPKGLHFDAYSNRFVVTNLPFGLGGPFQRLRLWLAARAR